MKARSHALRALLAACVLLIAAPVVAAAAPTVAKLRVEAEGRPLDRGTSYVNDTARVAT
jgi:hypothetical protein